MRIGNTDTTRLQAQFGDAAKAVGLPAETAVKLFNSCMRQLLTKGPTPEAIKGFEMACVSYGLKKSERAGFASALGKTAFADDYMNSKGRDQKQMDFLATVALGIGL
jgi:hypothetical protein